ncbi:hypothetical protein CXB51_007502 [Gossypium anomalum]|uniref:Integrase catalytic domain-containing protein n=1 Tax=Gossypium anomalum TaxID=47600 RepID=A0A8J6D6X2_9ROSI|nr:hypothetical protein CXB51_007502 [Gossypium anomalum]
MVEALSSVRTTVTNVKFIVEKFDGTNNFGMWQCEILDVLCQQELDIALEEKPDKMDDKEWAKINRQACDEDKALLLLNSLPDEYDHLTTTLLHGKDPITFDAVSEYDEESDFSLVGMAMACHTNEWILDSGCTYHMCPNKDWFSSLKELEGGVVLMGNDNACKTMGVGTVQLKKHDSSIQVLTDVRYIPSLKKNLISLGTAVSAKYVDLEATRSWHMRLGHAGEKALQTLAKQGLLKGTNSCKLEFYEHCVLGKQTRVKFGPTIHNTKGILEYVHSDVWGPTKVASLGGMHYFVTFVDDYSRKTGRKVKQLRSDNGTEYKNDPFLQVCQDEGIVRHFTIRDTPQQNGVAERMNRTILEKVQCMLSNAGLGKEFWAEAVTYACHLINRLPSAAINEKIPMEMWIGKSTTDYDSLHVFGSTAYYHVKESKLDPRAKKALFLGITDGVKRYRLWCPDTRKIIFSRNVTFDESTILKYKDSQKDDKTSSTLQQVELKKVNDDPTNIRGTNDEEILTEEPLQQQDSIACRRPRREIRKPARFDDIMAYALPIVDDDVPSTYTKAISNPDGGKKAIGCKWVYAKKEGFPGKNEIRYKARLVVKGYTQKEGIDYNEVFSPVVKHSSIQILLALVAQYDLELVQLDVKTAFLHGDLEEQIYITQPDGFKVAGKENWVCKLTKSLYGLKQSPRHWYKRFDQFMKGQRYTRSKFDHCVYFQKLQEGTFIYLLLYVVDMLIASKSKRDRTHDRVSLSQKQYLKKVLQQFGMNEQTKPVSTPLASHFKLSVQLSPSMNTEREYMLQVPYSIAVGSLMYAMVCTRPDISQAVSIVSRHMHNPGKGHWQAVKWILRYIQKTVDVGLLLKQDNTLGKGVIGYVDSNYADDLDKQRSTTGYVFTLAGGPIS